jgi:CheY-like chemotaxis protein
MPRPVALIVNDDPSQLRLNAVVLEKGGFATRTCASAEEALALLADVPTVDLIVTDLHMPGIDGWRFCRLLRSPEFAACNAIRSWWCRRRSPVTMPSCARSSSAPAVPAGDRCFPRVD